MILHQIWLQGKEVPSKYDHARAEWRRLHPHWEIRLWSEADIIELIEAKYSQYTEFFKTLPLFIQRADVSRAFILHAFGGVYADMDYVPLRCMDDLVSETDVVFGMDTWFLGIQKCNNAVILSPQGHPFWMNDYLPYVVAHVRDESILDIIISQFFAIWPVLVSTGPLAIERAASKYVKFLPPGVLYSNGTYGDHLKANTWMQKTRNTTVLIMQFTLLGLALYGLVRVILDLCHVACHQK